MRILYAIQGTGGGHISRAAEMLPALERYGEVDILISGGRGKKEFPFSVKYRMQGLGYFFGRNGGIDLIRSFKEYSVLEFLKEVRGLDVSNYDLVLSDMEPISAWACLSRGKRCFGLSNQLALIMGSVSKPKWPSLFGEAVLRFFAPVSNKIGIHYQSDQISTYSPIIRKLIRERSPSDLGHGVVYLPAYSVDAQLKALSGMTSIRWHLFSKNVLQREDRGHVVLHPVDDELFVRYLVTSHCVLTAAGFSTTTEALYLGKKLMVIPQRGQYEQRCNAHSLSQLGISVSMKLSETAVRDWLENSIAVKLEMPDNVDEIAKRIFSELGETQDNYIDYLVREQFLV